MSDRDFTLPDFASVGSLLAPRSVAVIGASSDPARIGGRPIRWMLEGGFTGTIYPVNPNRPEIQGIPAYRSVADLPAVPDVAIIALAADQVEAALEEVGRKGTRAAIVFASGFAEAGDDGTASEAALLAVARRHGIRMIGPNSLGLFNGRLGWYATFSAIFARGWPVPGGLGIVSQSGAFGANLAVLARNAGLGAPLCVMTGNETDVSVGEVIGWMASDPATTVIAAYVEGIRDGALFMAGLEAARRAGKPVIVMKVGRSRIGVDAAKSHTASLAGDDVVIDAILREFGAIRATSAEQLLDFAYFASFGVFPRANSLGIVTASGGAGVLMSDIAEDLGLPMPPLPEAAQQRLLARLPYAAVRNPVDCTANVSNDTALLALFIDEVVEAGVYGSIVIYFGQGAGLEPFATLLRDALAERRGRHPDRLFVLSGSVSPEQSRYFASIGVPTIEDPNRAIAAVAAMGRIGDALARPPRRLRAGGVAVAVPEGAFSEAAAKRFLAGHGFPVAEEQVCATAEEAEAAARRIGFPVVAKVSSPEIAHKSDFGGVVTGLADAAAVRAAFADILARARAAHPAARLDGVLIARQVTGGVESIMGIKCDPAFGPIALFGLGGVFSETMNDVTVHRCPVTAAEAREMILAIRGAAILAGARGRPKADVDAGAAVLARLSELAVATAGTIAAIDLNPILLLPEGKGACLLDAAIEPAR